MGVSSAFVCKIQDFMETAMEQEYRIAHASEKLAGDFPLGIKHLSCSLLTRVCPTYVMVTVAWHSYFSKPWIKSSNSWACRPVSQACGRCPLNVDGMSHGRMQGWGFHCLGPSGGSLNGKIRLCVKKGETENITELGEFMSQTAQRHVDTLRMWPKFKEA